MSVGGYNKIKIKILECDTKYVGFIYVNLSFKCEKVSDQVHILERGFTIIGLFRCLELTNLVPIFTKLKRKDRGIQISWFIGVNFNFI